MIVAGTINFKMASRLRRLYEQMAEPKYVIAMGGCTIAGGPYYEYGYNIVNGVDLVVPGGHLRARLPPAAGSPVGRADAFAGQDQGAEAHRGARPPKRRPGWARGLAPGVKAKDELPLAHNSGCVEGDEPPLVYDHQKVKP